MKRKPTEDAKEECRVRYRVLIEQDEDHVFVAEVPSLPGCVTQGNTRSEASANAQEAIAGYLEAYGLMTRRFRRRGPNERTAYSCQRGVPWRIQDPARVQ